MEPVLHLYTDGGCLKNPGGIGGYGAVILDGDNEERISCGYVSSTNNRMELMGILAALEYVSDTERPFMIHTDSEYAYKIISGKMNPRSNLDIINEIKFMLFGRTYDIEWVKGHAGNKYNEICDQLATKAMHSDMLLNDGGYVVAE